jgi:hypothetical protein
LLGQATLLEGTRAEAEELPDDVDQRLSETALRAFDDLP